MQVALQADGQEGEIVKLLNMDTPVKEAEMVTFFMPTGDKAKKTFSDLKAGKFGHPEATFADVTLRQVSAHACAQFSSWQQYSYNPVTTFQRCPLGTPFFMY